MGFFDRISQGLQRSRDKFKEEMNVLLDRGPDLDEEFWDGLEETLILADIGGAAACDIGPIVGTHAGPGCVGLAFVATRRRTTENKPKNKSR